MFSLIIARGLHRTNIGHLFGVCLCSYHQLQDVETTKQLQGACAYATRFTYGNHKSHHQSFANLVNSRKNR